MRFRWTRLATSMVAMAVIATSTRAQTAATDEGKRKVKSKNSPAYPELARRMNVSGKVKIEVIVMPDGRVRSTAVRGALEVRVRIANLPPMACARAFRRGQESATDGGEPPG